MKTIDKQKGLEIVNNLVEKASDASKKAVDGAQTGARLLTEKTKDEIHKYKMQKYRPVFPDRLCQENPSIPNIIMIVDDVERRDVDVCAGAVGWLGIEQGVEILYLYDEAIQMSGINFIPMASNDTVYYIDNFNKNRYIKTDYFFAKAYEERMAELKHIAFALGAKSCSIEISESNAEEETHQNGHKGKAKIEGTKVATPSLSANSEKKSTNSKKTTRVGRVYANFIGSDNPKTPELKWFRNDDNIKRLIEMRFENGNSIQSERFELSGSSSATMSQKTAKAIDGAIKRGKIKGKYTTGTTVSDLVTKEYNSTLTYTIDF